MSDKIKGYSSIPSIILQDTTLSPYAKLLYGVVLSSSFGDKVYSTYKNANYMKQAGMTASSVTNAIADLDNKGYIRIEGSNQNRKIYPLVSLTSNTPEIVSVPRSFNEEEHSFIKHYLDIWGKPKQLPGGTTRKTGTVHRLKGVGKTQGKNIWKMFHYLKEAEVGIYEFYQKHKAQLDPTWMQKHNITEQKIKNSGTSFKKALTVHWKKLEAGIKEEQFIQIPDSLEDFFLQSFTDGTGKTIYRSWLLYWACNPVGVIKTTKEETELIESKYNSDDYMRGMFKRFYNSSSSGISKRVFNYNPHKWSIQQQNDLTRYFDSIVERLSPYYIMEQDFEGTEEEYQEYRKNTSLRSVNITAFIGFYIRYFTGESWKEIPTMINSPNGLKMYGVNSGVWDTFIDWIAGLSDIEVNSKWKKKCHLIKNKA